jgi:hypothetical protein
MDTPVCSICQQPIQLETSKTDEKGKPIHEDCYVQRLLASLQDPPNPQHTS